MLISLSIRDFVLIDRLDLTVGAGLSVLTGETGAGKSILLDALGIALGQRVDRTLIRAGMPRCSVSATFEVSSRREVGDLLLEHGLDGEDELVLRRVVTEDGRSRAFVNDQPVGVALLRRIADLLVEVHGQHERQSLLDPARQRELLDAFAGAGELVAEVAKAHRAFGVALSAEREQAAALATSAAEQDYLRHVQAELEALAPRAGEAPLLGAARARLMNREKLAQAMDDALRRVAGDGGVGQRLGGAIRDLERMVGEAGPLLEPALAALERARVEVEDAEGFLQTTRRELDEPHDLEQIEERLFALRAAARKHRVEVEGLPDLLAGMTDRLANIDAGEDLLTAAKERTRAARVEFVATAKRLSAERRRAAGELAAAVSAELPPLRLERARFEVACSVLPEEVWTAGGAEQVAFLVATNPGQTPGPLGKVASGGELARLMLALKVILARSGSRPCLIFDEVDSGIGGATADAVGQRLARLGDDLQVLVVTHQPQVAALASHHFRIEKQTGRRRSAVDVAVLDDGARREEIARMLAGATVTEAARAAASSLIRGTA